MEDSKIRELRTMNLEALTSVKPSTKGGKDLLEGILATLDIFKSKFADTFADMQSSFTALFEAQNLRITDLEKDMARVNIDNKALKEENIALKKTLAVLDERIDENEAYERKATLILSGDEIPPMATGYELPDKTLHTALDLFKSKLKLSGIRPEHISISHRLKENPKSNSTLKRDIMVKFSHREAKNTVLTAARKMKVPNFYVNEQLTSTRKKIATSLRIAKKNHPSIIASTSSQQGSIYVWVKPPRPDQPGARNTRFCINTMAKLQDFCSKTLNISVDAILPKKNSSSA